MTPPSVPTKSPAANDSSTDDHWVRAFMFGDSHYDTHSFVETFSRRAPKEIACALAASCLVSPLVSIIDRCIVQDISGSAQFMSAVKKATKEMIVTPRRFFGGLSFQLTLAVYFGTYAVANLSELALDTARVTDEEDRKTRKVYAASAANISLLAWRDSIFARAYGNAKKHTSTPLRTIGLFAARDASTMYATFYAAPVAAVYLQENFGVEKNTAELGTALGIPAVSQFLTAPLHIHAMDYYNRRTATVMERLATIRAEFSTVAAARALRILPAFGIGSFSNNKFRETFIQNGIMQGEEQIEPVMEAVPLA